MLARALPWHPDGVSRRSNPEANAVPSAAARAAPKTALEPELERLETLLERGATNRLARLSAGELLELSRLYRFAATRLAEARTAQASPEHVARLARIATRAHLALRPLEARETDSVLRRLVRFFVSEVPQAVRAEWAFLLASFVVLYGLAAISWVAVAHDRDAAWALTDPNMVAIEIQQLEETPAGEPFRGNFTFGLDESSATAGWIMAHNMFVGVLFFTSALVPPLYVAVLSQNGFMLGTYTGVAHHYGQAGSILSILMCHGTLELQAFVIAGAAGLVLLRGVVAPGPWSRRHALRRESRRGWRLVAAVFPLLFVAGLIEAFVSPHAPTNVRLVVAVVSGIVLVAWLGFGGRGARVADES